MLQNAPMYAYIPAKDVDRARKFYEGTLGFKPKEETAGGVVYDSTPEEEYLESGNKARAMLRAIDQAEINAAEMRVGSLGYG